MMTLRRRASLGALAGATALCVAALAASAGGTTSGSRTAGPPTTVKFPWGTFTVAPQIVDRVKTGKRLHFKLSFVDPCAASFTASVIAGIKKAAKDFNVDAQLVGPCGGSTQKQVTQIENLVASKQVDCLPIAGGDPTAYINPINRAVAAGVPVFTFTFDSPRSHRFAFYGQDLLESGRIDGRLTVAWAKRTRHTLNKILRFSGQPSASGQIDRMKGFQEVVKKAFPNVKFGTVLNVAYTPTTWFSVTESAYRSNPDADLLYYGDQSVEGGAKFIRDNNLTGKVFAIGFNITPEIVKGIAGGQIIATVGQRIFLQGYNPVKACAQFLRRGIVPKPLSYVGAEVVTPANVGKYKGLKVPK